MFGFRLIAPEVIASICSISWLPYEAPLSERGDQVEDHQGEDVAAAQLPAEHV